MIPVFVWGCSEGILLKAIKQNYGMENAFTISTEAEVMKRENKSQFLKNVIFLLNLKNFIIDHVHSSLTHLRPMLSS